MNWIKRHPNWAIAGLVVSLTASASLAFGYFEVHTLFTDERVEEAAPVFDAAPAGPTSTAAPTPLASLPPTTSLSDLSLPDLSLPDPAPSSSGLPSEVSGPSDTTAVGVVATEHEGAFVSRNHPTTGQAIVLGNGTGQRFLRFEDFQTDNGPDLSVYLVNSSAGGVDEFIDLGKLKGNRGEQNYEIPADIDLDVYDTVLIWCVRFSSPFGEARLSAV
jgi:hypothetical protein